ncbi:MAG: DNA mismatch repair endonuclease MutL, partial [Clostridiales Family XIII bacterium]|nr:DNA mismatch repair endonuclease MutL [Clostridiales Family XIII bacterium]
LIRVSDNGCGISAEELSLAVFPHATSKISADKDLDDIRTLGFRGEALASIAAVSKLTLISKTKDAAIGAKLYTSGGGDPQIAKAGSPEGTSVLVEDLFYNVPARRKFLKPDRAETAVIIDFVARMAIAWPRVRFSMGHNGEDDFSTLGNGDTRNAIANVAGVTISADLLPVRAEEGDMRLTAYISPPDHDRKTRKRQYFFVNGRNVSDSVLSEAIANAYKGFIFEGRFPTIYLFLDIDPKKTDVNVHPSKTQIRFSDKKTVCNFVENAVTEALRENGSTAKVRDAAQAGRAKRAENAFYSLKPAAVPAENSPAPKQNLVRDGGAGADRTNIYANEDDDPVETVAITSLWSGENAAEDAAAEGAEVNKLEAGDTETRETVTGNAPPAKLFDESPVPEYMGRIFGLYLLARTAETFYIIDQHAAHERINYEKFIAQVRTKEKLTQGLLTPLIVTVPAAARPSADEWFAWLATLGFEADEFGGSRFAVRAFPAFLSYDEAESFLGDILDSAGTAPPENPRAADRLISRACKSSVKLNDALSPEASQTLIAQLFACENPFTCPHGRPAFIAMTGGELDRMFRRDG